MAGGAVVRLASVRAQVVACVERDDDDGQAGHDLAASSSTASVAAAVRRQSYRASTSGAARSTRDSFGAGAKRVAQRIGDQLGRPAPVT